MAVWISLHHLPLPFFIPSYLQRIGNTLGQFLRPDDLTLALTHPMYARICVEVDVSVSLPSQIWIGSSKEQGFWQNVEFEGNITFCEGYGLLGHIEDDCRKKRRGNLKSLPSKLEKGKMHMQEGNERPNHDNQGQGTKLVKPSVQRWEPRPNSNNVEQGAGSNTKD